MIGHAFYSRGTNWAQETKNKPAVSSKYCDSSETMFFLHCR
jgi:hypothetical protein